MYHNRTSKYLKQKQSDNGKIDQYTIIFVFNTSLAGTETTSDNQESEGYRLFDLFYQALNSFIVLGFYLGL